MQNVFITGVSSGIGLALAKIYLSKGWKVYGTSRSCPIDLINNSNFIFKKFDLEHLVDGFDFLDGEFSFLKKEGVSIAYLNAGTADQLPLSAIEITANEVLRSFKVNSLANKVFLDILLSLDLAPQTIVVSASIAGVRYRAGMLSYSVSKAALSALMGVYSKEYPHVFFAVLGLCNVDTALSRNIVFGNKVDDFPDHIALRERFSIPGYAVTPDTRASQLFNLVHEKKLDGVESGKYIDFREILESESIGFN